MPRRQHSELHARRAEERIRADGHSIRPLLRERCERRIEFAGCAGFEDSNRRPMAHAPFYAHSRRTPLLDYLDLRAGQSVGVGNQLMQHLKSLCPNSA